MKGTVTWQRMFSEKEWKRMKLELPLFLRYRAYKNGTDGWTYEQATWKRTASGYGYGQRGGIKRDFP